MILNDKQIKKLSEEEEMITPFVAESVSKGISHGLNSFGYDLRCGAEFKIFTNIKGATADPKNFSEDNFVTVKGEEFILIPPNVRHSMKATEDGPCAYLYIKDCTWTVVGISADEELPDKAMTVEEANKKFEKGEIKDRKNQGAKSDSSKENKSIIIEGALLFQVHLIKERTGNRYNLRSPAGRFLGMRNPIGIGLYTFAGIGAFYYNPVGQSPDGNKYKLKPLRTEGQGLPGGAEPYSGVSGCIPVGFGIRKAFNGNGGIKLEASYRFTFTDYIDDVSTVYYNNDYLADNVSAVAAQMADPSLGATYYNSDGNGTLMGPFTHTEAGYQRGNPENNDGYMFITLSAYRQLNNAARGYRTIRINQRRRIKASF